MSHPIGPESTPSPYSVPTLLGIACVLAIVTGTLVSACDSGGTSSDRNDAEALIPLEEGNTWSAKTDEGRFSLTVNSEGNVEVFESPSGSRLEDTTIVLRKKSDGLLLGFNLKNANNFKLRYPIEAGDTYQYTDAAKTHKFEVSVSEQTIEVPAGTFDTLVYSVRLIEEPADDPLRARIYIKPGFGPIRYNGNPGSNYGPDFRLVGTNVSS